MGTLIFVCPTTGEEVSTGIEMRSETLESLRTETVRCPCCLQVHQLAGLRAWLVQPADSALSPNKAA
jgi:hypothetical protein